jgi:NAD(P)-dependent dehydrogenase (short-subunit alcohol dehydrogenase family)
MKRILITGANRGIGLALVEKVLESSEEHQVYLGARSLERGEAAADELCTRHPHWQNRIQVVQLDVADSASVKAAAEQVRGTLNSGEALYGIVNNAGMGYPHSDLQETLEVNTYGVKRVVEAFLPLLEPQVGRLVNITSAAGPNFVEGCSADIQSMLVDPNITWEQLEAFLQKCLSAEGDTAVFNKFGMGDGSSYGISKAAANAYTLILAREHPNFIINACTPGFIETELTRPIAKRYGKTPAEMGMKTPAEGTISTMHLLFGEIEQSGHYFGSDGLRSPMHCYRAPGTPAYIDP